MNIGIVAAWFPKLSETFIMDHVTGLLDRGHDVSVIANNRYGKINHPNVEAYELLDIATYYRDPETSIEELFANLIIGIRYGFRHPKCLIRTLKQNKFGLFKVEPFLDAHFDIVHSHFGPVSMLPARLKQCGVVTAPLVVSFHGKGIRQGREQGPYPYRDVFEQANIILANSQATRDALIEFGADQERVRIHRMGIDLTRFSNSTPIQKNHVSKMQIVSVGRLSKQKGHSDGIQAIKRVKEGNPSLDLKYEIIGGGELEHELQNQINNLGMSDTVTLAGPLPRDAVVRKLANADVYLHPSHSEGLGIALLEAQASGLPVVSTLVGGIPEAVRENETALLAEPGDIDELHNHLQDLIQNPKKRVNMAKRGREFVEERYDHKKLIDDLVEIYESLL